MITFATQNAIMDAKFTKLDLVICRNLLIYLTPKLQQRVLSLLHYSLNPDGILLLGSSEAVNASSDLFEPIDSASRLFRRRKSIRTTERTVFPPSFFPALPGTSQETPTLKLAANIQTRADQLLLQSFSQPAVLVNN